MYSISKERHCSLILTLLKPDNQNRHLNLGIWQRKWVNPNGNIPSFKGNYLHSVNFSISESFKNKQCNGMSLHDIIVTWGRLSCSYLYVLGTPRLGVPSSAWQAAYNLYYKIAIQWLYTDQCQMDDTNCSGVKSDRRIELIKPKKQFKNIFFSVTWTNLKKS